MQDALFGDEAVVDRTWSVTDLSRAVGAVIEQAFPGEVWVRGEIRDLPPPGDARRHRPHLYFDLVEPGPPGSRPAATLPVVLWATDRKRVNTALRRSGIRVSVMDSGVDVRIRGRVRWWAPGGRPQLQMTGIDPDYTLGRLAADRAAVLAALDADGLLDANATRVMPVLPERVGLVTSIGSAAHADVRRVLATHGLDHLLVEVDARTQGPEAVATLPRALAAAVAAGAEVVLLVRGGGSRVELACFDNELVARAVALCEVPVITGIGHQIDDSVADQVAHTVCPTPSAAAAAVVALIAATQARAEELWASVTAASRRSLDRHRAELAVTGRHAVIVAGGALRAGDAHVASASDRLRRAGPAGVAGPARRLDLATAAMGRDARRDVAGARREVEGAASRLARRPGLQLERLGRDLEGIDARVRAADPALALARGWSITYAEDGSLVRRVADVAAGGGLVTVVADGRLRSVVTDGDDGAPPPSHRPGSSDG